MVTLEQYIEDLQYFAKLSPQDRNQAVGYAEFTSIVLMGPEDFHSRIEVYRKTRDIYPGVFMCHKDSKNEIALCMKIYPELNTMDIMLESGECYESVKISQYEPTIFTAETALDQLFRAFNCAKKQIRKES